MQVEGLSFGEIIVDGRSYHQDVALTRDGVKTWHRLASHTVELEDIKELLPVGVSMVVFGTGFGERLVVSPSVKMYLLGRGIGVVEHDTDKAVKTFQELVEKGQSVVAFLHLFC